MASKWREIEAREGKPIAEIILDLYRTYGPGLSQKTIAEHLGVSQPTVSQWMSFLRLKQAAHEAMKGGEKQSEIA